MVGPRATLLDVLPLIQAALDDAVHPSSVPAHLRRLASAAAGVRDHLPLGSWQIIAALSRVHAPRLSRPLPARLLLRLDELATLGAALWGTIEDTMPRDASWRFFEIGKRLERAITLVTILGAAAAASRRAEAVGRGLDEDGLLAAVLIAAGLSAATPVRPDGTLDRQAALSALLVSDSDPFSLDFQIAAVAGHLRELPRPGVTTIAGETAVARALEMAQSARGLSAAALGDGRIAARADAGAPGSVAALQTALAPLQTLLPEISNLLTRAYFAHVLAQPA